MRALLIFLAAVVVIILGLWATLVLYFDEARLKQIATEQVRAQTGRELEINGPLKLDFFPGVSLVAEDVRLSGPENYTGPDLFTADQFRMSLKLLPLLSGKVETGDIGLEQAEVNIHTDASGTTSLDGLTAAEPVPAEPAAPATEISTGQIRLRNIRLNVSDAPSDSRQSFIVENLQIDGFAYDQPVPFSFEGAFGDPPVVEDIELEGTLVVPSGGGPIEVREMGMTSNVSGMLVGLSGRAALNPGPPMVANFSDGRITLGDSEFQASFSYRDGARPVINADLSGKMLDVDSLLERLPETAATTPAADGGSASAPDEPSPLLLLRDMDLTASLALERMRISGLELSDVRTRVEARNGVVTIDPLAGALAGGRVDAVATIDLNVEPAQVQIAPVFDLESLGQALAPWGLDQFVTGSGVLDLKLNARGLDPQAILGSLNGVGEYNFTDGSIQGVNLDGMVDALAARNITQAVTAGVGGATTFQTLAGELRVENGTIRMPGMRILTELLGITGDVQLGLADLSLDGNLQLQSERLGTVPIALDGTLTAPKLMPDVGEALKQEAGRRLFDLIKERTSKEEEESGGG